MRDANRWPDLIKEIEDSMLISESDYYAQDRERDEREANCKHRNIAIEEARQNGLTFEYLVCHDCGADSSK
jgi:hypothetical protein